MLGPLSLVTVRQKHDEGTGTQPLCLRGGDELVDNDLGTVGKITELGLPHAEHVRVIHGVAVIESQHGGLGKRAIVDTEARLIGREVLKRDVALPAHLVVEDGVSVAESASTAVLTGKADRYALQHEGTEGKCLAVGPVVGATLLEDLAPALQNGLADLGKHAEVGGNCGESVDNGPERLLADRGFDGLE